MSEMGRFGSAGLLPDSDSRPAECGQFRWRSRAVDVAEVVRSLAFRTLTGSVQIVLGGLASAKCMKLVCRRMFHLTGGWGRRHSSLSLIS